MRVLSLFDGISCGRVALTAANIPPNVYYASEVDKYAMTVAQANHPTTIQVGDVRVVRQMCEAGVFGKIDMLIGGSPCQNLSFAGKQKGLSTKEGVEITTLEQYKQLVSEGFEFEGQSYLFWEYVWIRELLKPTWWLLENVRMSKKWLQVFNEIMGVEGVLINSALVSAQNRQRYYWCNWPVSQPEDRGIYLRDIIESSAVDRVHTLSSRAIDRIGRKTYSKPKILPEKTGTLNTTNNSSRLNFDSGTTLIPIQINPDKAKPLMASSTRSLGGNGCAAWSDGITYRKLTPVECERLQGLPDQYTAHVSNTQRYKMLGNGWQCDTIIHIFECLKLHAAILGVKL